MDLISENDKLTLRVYNALRSVMDPELGISITDMGLIYRITSTRCKEIIIEMTLSSESCPSGETIIDEVRSCITSTFKDENCTVNLVWSPAWSVDFMTGEGKRALGIS